MNITGMELRNFTSYKELNLVPDSPGLLLLVGGNGCGKSTVIEGICWALHGQMLRSKRPPSLATTTARLSFEAQGKHWLVERKRYSSKTELTLSQDGQDVTGQTPTDTQAKINAVVGDRDLFIATRIFSKDLMARFAVATDKERKAMLEALLGLSRFDVALERCRAELAKLRGSLSKAETRLQERQSMLARQQALLLQVEGPVEDHEFLEAEHKVALAEYQAEQDAWSDVEQKHRDAYTAWVKADKAASLAKVELEAEMSKASQLKAKLARVKANKSCPTCLREMDGALSLIAQYEAAELAAIQKAIDAADLKAMDTADDAMVAERASEATAAARAGVKQPDRARADALKERWHRARQEALEVGRRKAEVNDTIREVQVVETEAVALRDDEKVLLAAERVLGLRGARTLLLGRALGRLEDAANVALQKLDLPIQIGVSGTTELKSKKEVDAISITVTGAGAGDYDMGSAGERARVDVGLLMGLSALAGTTGFIAFDEVFDALDTEGASKVAEYLGELSKDRQVLVVSHHQDLRAQFPRGRVMEAVKVNDVSRLEQR